MATQVLARPLANWQQPVRWIVLVHGLALAGAFALEDVLPALLLLPIFALLFSILFKLPSWWWAINAIFWPLVILAQRSGIPPWAWLMAFAVTYIVFGQVYRTRVPLFLSSLQSLEKLETVLPRHDRLRFVDLGAGDGRVLAFLAPRHWQWQFVGVERAFLPWVMARFRTHRMQNARMRRHDLWSTSLADADVVYTFLSPAPMKELWEKAQREMKPGSVLISNSFAIPDVSPDAVVEVYDWLKTRLYLYRL